MKKIILTSVLILFISFNQKNNYQTLDKSHPIVLELQKRYNLTYINPKDLYKRFDDKIDYEYLMNEFNLKLNENSIKTATIGSTTFTKDESIFDNIDFFIKILVEHGEHKLSHFGIIVERTKEYDKIILIIYENKN